jgi:hypothetical protein
MREVQKSRHAFVAVFLCAVCIAIVPKAPVCPLMTIGFVA